MNTFGYVGGSPLIHIDSRGLDSRKTGPYDFVTLCDAMRKIAARADKNPFLNGKPFDKSDLGNEVIPMGGNSPILFPGQFSDSRNFQEYDVQYIQVGWSISKTYGAGSSNLALAGYALAPLFSGDWDYFSERNLSANIRGLQLGEFGARKFKNFKDFVKDLCPDGCK